MACADTIRIESIGAGGVGVGRLVDGRVAFVPRSAPGDRITIDVVAGRRSYVRGMISHVIEESRERTEPACRHFLSDACGGCQLQHLTYETQVRAKSRIIGDALRRIGGRDLPDPEVVPAAGTLGYRNRIRLTRIPGSDPPRFGFHRHDDPGRLFRLEDCLIAAPRVRRAWGTLSSHPHLVPAATTGIQIYEREDGTIDVRLFSDPGCGKVPCAAALEQVLGEGATVCVSRPGDRYTPAFEQVNREMARLLREQVVRELEPQAGELVLDLFGGTGAVSLLLAGKGARVKLVESDGEAVRAARARLRETSVECVRSRVEDYVKGLPVAARIIVNPPRTGLSGRVSAALERHGRMHPGTLLVYVSCDPATLARDLKRMPCYVIKGVRGFDLFPQTAHVETVVTLEAE